MVTPKTRPYLNLVQSDGLCFIWRREGCCAGAADEKFPMGVYGYAIQLAKGEGCRPDLLKAINLLEGLAGTGRVSALEMLATICYDLAVVAEVFLRACELGSISALHRYAQMNCQGEGVPTNLGRALASYRRAAQGEWHSWISII